MADPWRPIAQPFPDTQGARGMVDAAAPPPDTEAAQTGHDATHRADLFRINRNVNRMLEKGAGKEDVLGYLGHEGFTPDTYRRAVLTQKAGPQPAGKGITDKLMSGLLLGFSDELGAAIDATTQSVFGWKDREGKPQVPGNSWSERYDTALGRQRASEDLFAENNPVTSTALSVAGGLANPVTQLIPGGGSMPVQMAKGAGVGAGLGGVAGFGAGEGGFDERLENAGRGAAWGAAIGGAAPPVLSALGAGAQLLAESAPGRFVADKVISPTVRAVGNIAETFTPRAPGRAASAAPPEGGPPIVQDSFPARVSEGATSLADYVSGPAAARRGAVQRLVRRLERDNITPQQFADEMARLGEDAAPFLAGGKNVQMLAKTTARLPGTGMNVADEGARAEARSIGPRMMGEVEGNVAGDTRFFTAFEKAAQQRSEQARKTYQAARDQGLKVSGDMAHIEANTPAIQQARATIEAEAARNGIRLDPVDLVDKIKQAMNAQANAAYGPGFHPGKKIISDTADRWEEALWAANPKLKAASDLYAANSGIMGALDQGRKFLIGGTGEQGTRNAADALASQFRGMSTQEQEAFRVGVASAIREKLMAGPDAARAFAKQLDQSGLLREKLVEIVGPVNAERIFTMAGKEMKRAQGWRGVMSGSDTAWNAAAMADEGMPAVLNPARGGGPMTRLTDYVFDRVSQGMRGNEAVRDQLAPMLFSANPTDRARLIEEITRAHAARNARVLPRAITSGAASQVGRQER